MLNKVHCAHILVKSEKEAKEVLDRLKKGEKFSSVAKAVSNCPSGKQGGDLGRLQEGKWSKSLRRLLCSNKGETSVIVKTQFGCHIIKRLE